jgi:hypothetical protein
MGVAVPEQSLLARHCAHCAVVVLQCGVLAGHWASLEQPSTHRAVVKSQ